MIPVTMGTAMSATKGESFFVMIRASISTTVANPKTANIVFPP